MKTDCIYFVYLLSDFIILRDIKDKYNWDTMLTYEPPRQNQACWVKRHNEKTAHKDMPVNQVVWLFFVLFLMSYCYEGKNDEGIKFNE